MQSVTYGDSTFYSNLHSVCKESLNVDGMDSSNLCVSSNSTPHDVPSNLLLNKYKI